VIDYRPIQQSWSQPSVPRQTQHAQRYSTSRLRRAARLSNSPVGGR
jgi:hypothetical protein